MELLVDFPRRAQSPRNERRTSFVEVIDVKYVENLSSEYKERLWFSRKEQDSFKYQAAHTIRTITSAMSMAQFAAINIQETSAFMGFENYMSKNTSQEIRKRRQAIILAVLAEQSRQRLLGIHDSDALAHVAQAISDRSRKRAQIIAMIHADEHESPHLYPIPF